jgi:tetratricopeptide (TPR) repeat protein
MRPLPLAVSFILLATTSALAQSATKTVRLDPKHAVSYYKRGLARLKGGDVENAIADFSQAVKFDPKHLNAYFARGAAFQSKGEWDKAISDFDQIIELDPKNANAYSARAVAWQNKGDLDTAIADCDEALRLDPKHLTSYRTRGIAQHQQGKYDKARADLNEAVRLDSKDFGSSCTLAWLFATCPDERYRDGKRAIELATNACEVSGWKNAHGVGALAAAYAEIGDFVNAIKWQEEFLRLCSEAEKKKWGFLLELYKSGKPFRGQRQEFRFGGEGRYSIESVA